MYRGPCTEEHVQRNMYRGTWTEEHVQRNVDRGTCTSVRLTRSAIASPNASPPSQPPSSALGRADKSLRLGGDAGRSVTQLACRPRSPSSMLRSCTGRRRMALHECKRTEALVACVPCRASHGCWASHGCCIHPSLQTSRDQMAAVKELSNATASTQPLVNSRTLTTSPQVKGWTLTTSPQVRSWTLTTSPQVTGQRNLQVKVKDLQVRVKEY
ncbi:uncharacterized protein M421DRAFT_311823 [Didymella exigua CBS 183.55]|uniref:Uncharacterized protein n=1 Tax=Didymella exigua CBS 183.55 TaxID=1150837 RepID=A0A6A5RA30_9PLEO|nr:uncharacterized protein M421DRAFT_311823 [Didymella exigua CBS 183.55]KAF1923526.1 hypothetical protein M421DRAFT_311823 [Didymella exigua CBS 183.55]